MNRSFLVTASVLVALAATGTAVAVDGQIPIWSDTTVIDKSGSYVVTRNLVGGGATPIITIDCNAIPADRSVEIDFNGFHADQPGALPVVDVVGVGCTVGLRNGRTIGGSTGINVASALKELVVEDMRIGGVTGDAINVPNVNTLIVRRNVLLGLPGSGARGIDAFGGATKTAAIIEDNVIKEFQQQGMLLLHYETVRVARNHLYTVGQMAASNAGIEATGVKGLFEENTITNAGRGGFRIRGQAAPELTAALKVVNNMVAGCGNGVGINVETTDTTGALVLDNVVQGCNQTGIRVERGQHVLVQNNVTSGNGAWGLHVTGVSIAVVTRNYTAGNAGVGCVGPSIAGDYCNEGLTTSLGDNIAGVVPF